MKSLLLTWSLQLPLAINGPFGFVPRGVRMNCCWKEMPEKNGLAWKPHLNSCSVCAWKGDEETWTPGCNLCILLSWLPWGFGKRGWISPCSGGLWSQLEWFTRTFPGRPRASGKDGNHHWILEGRLWDAAVRWNSSFCVIQLVKRMAQNQLVPWTVASWTTCASSVPLRNCLVELGSPFFPCFPS